MRIMMIIAGENESHFREAGCSAMGVLYVLGFFLVACLGLFLVLVGKQIVGVLE